MLRCLSASVALVRKPLCSKISIASSVCSVNIFSFPPVRVKKIFLYLNIYHSIQVVVGPRLMLVLLPKHAMECRDRMEWRTEARFDE
jgi:hypothetical protein